MKKPQLLRVVEAYKTIHRVEKFTEQLYMKTKFNHIAVHKNNMRDREARSVTKEGVKYLRALLDDAKLRKELQKELTGEGRHE
ncbi:hypothetical protein ACP179_17660 [Xenorhabdus stockiae]|uniref:hypothetical protein n=1 Tax=Xenorhabdus stockiae TaxID=351614 RepID=UPI003CEE5D5F